MNENDFDPIDFLGLNSLNQHQIDILRPRLYSDIADYIVSKFIDDLSDTEIENIHPKLINAKDYHSLMSTILQYRPEFETQKIIYLEEYRHNFKLQKFIDCLI